MTILVIAEHNDAQLKSSTLNALKAAFELGSDVDVLVAGQSCEGAVKQAAAVAGVRKVLVAQGEAFNHCLPEALTDAVLAAQQAGGYSHILFTENTPRSYRELHHWHQGMHLARTYNKFFIKFLHIQKSSELSSAYHIGTSIIMPQQPGSSHIGNQ